MWYTSSVKCSELETDGMVLCEKKKKTMFSVHFYVLIGRFLGVKTLEKNPTGQQVTGLSSLARTECIPVAPLTQWHVVLLLEVGLCGFCQLPYKASIHPSLLTGTLISGLTWEEQDWHFLPPLLLTTFPADTRHRVSSTRSEGRREKEKTMLGNAPASSTDCLTASCEIQPIIRQQQRVRPST